jgi:hypothetical protein
MEFVRNELLDSALDAERTASGQTSCCASSRRAHGQATVRRDTKELRWIGGRRARTPRASSHAFSRMRVLPPDTIRADGRTFPRVPALDTSRARWRPAWPPPVAEPGTGPPTNARIPSRLRSPRQARCIDETTTEALGLLPSVARGGRHLLPRRRPSECMLVLSLHIIAVVEIGFSYEVCQTKIFICKLVKVI